MRFFLVVAWFVAVLSAATRAEEITRITTDGRVKTDLFATLDGAALLYSSQEKENLMCLMRLKLADGPGKENTVERIHPGATTSEVTPSLSADGKRLAYVRNDGNLHVQLVVADQASGESVSHDPGSGFAAVRYANILPDGSRTLFAFPEKTGQQIFSLAPNGKERQALTDDQGIDMAPRPSPDGRRIAFASAREGNFDLYVMGADGSGLLAVTEHPALDTHPAWSPDGKRLAFVSLRDGNFELYVMQADGSDVRRLTTSADREDYPVWSGDGRSLYFIGERRGKSDIYRLQLP